MGGASYQLNPTQLVAIEKRHELRYPRRLPARQRPLGACLSNTVESTRTWADNGQLMKHEY